MSSSYQEAEADDDEIWQPPREEQVQQELDKVYDRLEDKAADIGERRDLREVATYTIDPYMAKDYDDAISVEKQYDGDDLSGYRVGVHIADVPHYVEERGAINELIQEQAFTEYVPEPVNHMLPEDLSQAFSLTEGRDRLANTFELRFDKDGHFESCDIYASVINTDRNLSYNQANNYARMSSRSPALGEHGRSVVEDIDDFSFITRRLESRADRTHKDRTPAYRIIEELMITANEIGAQELPEEGLYRVHEGAPDKALYTPRADKHAGLETEEYAHFTSPIRRYSDIVNWRIYWGDFEGDTKDLHRIAEHLNEREDAVETKEKQDAAMFDGIDVVSLEE